MIKLRQLRAGMNVDAQAAFDAFDASFEHLQVLRNLVAHCILIDDSDDGTLFHLRSKDRTFKKADILASENFTNYCAMVAMSLRYALGLSNDSERRRPLPQTVTMPYGLRHYDMSVAVKDPAECSTRELDQFRNFVVKGGEVARGGLTARIRDAEALAFLTVQGTLAAIAALKNPAENYKRGVFERAGLTQSIDFYRYELGWVFVAEQFRNNGFSSQILKELLASADSQGVYATSTTDNEAMHKSLQHQAFCRTGESWPSTNQPAKRLCLFVRD